ncbi:hypothetical protein G6O67_001396 [Ophiocordyceps sinensis]|uniref:Uncharacterized protein n=1 Tax=Ophiocordyceps sinensis TaxID=72228 RepID=A0A8H4PXI6_9HYPO|nr:hypothetical protein G6O67_001396 [Ophiocordyceps sinensis]
MLVNFNACHSSALVQSKRWASCRTAQTSLWKHLSHSPFESLSKQLVPQVDLTTLCTSTVTWSCRIMALPRSPFHKIAWRGR